MSEQFGEDKFYNQPLKLREEIHTGRLKIKQAHGQALPVKQHSKCNMAVGMAWTFVTDSSQPIFGVSLASRPKMATQVWTCLDRTKHTSPRTHVIPQQFQLILALYFSPQFRFLLCACVAQTFLRLCDWRRGYCLTYCNDSIRKGKSCCPCHTRTLRSSHTQWFSGYRRHISQVMSSQKFTDEKRPSHGDSSRRKALQKFGGQFSPNASFITLRSVSWYYGNHRSAGCANEFSSQERTRCWCIVWNRRLWEHSPKSGIPGIKYQNKNFWRSRTKRSWIIGKRRSICVILSRSAIQNRSPWTPKTGKRCRQSGCAGILFELPGYDDARTSRYLKSMWRTNGRKWKESGTCDCVPKHEKLYVVEETIWDLFGRRKKFLRSQMHTEMQSQVVRSTRVLHDREVHQ